MGKGDRLASQSESASDEGKRREGERKPTASPHAERSWRMTVGKIWRSRETLEHASSGFQFPRRPGELILRPGRFICIPNEV